MTATRKQAMMTAARAARRFAKSLEENLRTVFDARGEQCHPTCQGWSIADTGLPARCDECASLNGYGGFVTDDMLSVLPPVWKAMEEWDPTGGDAEAAEIVARCIAHGEKEGREDYTGRAGDVAAGIQDKSWAWPFDTADEAYINAVTTSKICEEIGLPENAWNDVSDEWCAAFKRGYEAEYAARNPDSD